MPTREDGCYSTRPSSPLHPPQPAQGDLEVLDVEVGMSKGVIYCKNLVGKLF